MINHSNKIRISHLQRKAIIYLRQSTQMQVEFNTESTARQYALATKAKELGWPDSKIIVIDEDLGKSGTSVQGRTGFEKLMAAVGMAEVGAVLALEASRLSRSQADWHKLLDVCALTDTLILDHDGIYDPNEFNDRVLLGFKGTWSHTELHAFRLRLQGAKLSRAKKGELRYALPTGFSYDHDGKIILDPDEEVQNVVKTVFEEFKTLGTAFKVMRYFSTHHIPFPRRVWGYKEHGTLKWGPTNLSRILSILNHPLYAGAYVYGRTKSTPQIINGEIVSTRIRSMTQSDWIVLIKDAHIGYITWEEYQENKMQLSRNLTNRPQPGKSGSSRKGAALLQGLLLCGKCGRKMTVRYFGTNGNRVSYECNRKRQEDGLFPVCRTVPGNAIDEATAKHVLEMISEENLNLSFAVAREIEEQKLKKEKEWEFHLEKALYEANLAEKQYQLTDPENRMVARTLEKRWNEKLEALDKMEQSRNEELKQSPALMNSEQRQKILEMTKSVPDIWKHGKTSQIERKEILALLVKQISLTPQDIPERQTRIQVLWHTGIVTQIATQRPTKKEALATPNEIIDFIKAQPLHKSDKEIAAILNQNRLTPVKGKMFTHHSISWIRFKYGIPKPEWNPKSKKLAGVRNDGCLSTSELAKRLGVGIHTIHYWREKGIIKGSRLTDHGPWWHQITPESISDLRRKIRRIKTKAFELET
jgi:DNA invertase Pin-like site-specific DNA recombinase